MEQITYQKKIEHAWREFVARYITISVVWKLISYATIAAAVLLGVLGYFYYEWATNEQVAVKNLKQTRIGVTEGEIEAARIRILGLSDDYARAKSDRFEVAEPVGYKVRSAMNTAPLDAPVSKASTSSKLAP